MVQENGLSSQDNGPSYNALVDYMTCLSLLISTATVPLPPAVTAQANV